MSQFDPKQTPIPLRTQRAVSGSLILFILSALLLLGVQGITLYDRFARATEVGLDNRVWVFAQLEVEAKNVSLVLLEGLNGEVIGPAEDKRVRLAFDIYYSRIRTVSSVARDTFQDPAILAQFDQLRDQSQVLADKLDKTPLLNPPELTAFYSLFKANMPFIRKVANAAMIDSIKAAEETRQSRHWILGQLQLLLGVVILLMVASVSQAMKVSRSIGHHAAETTKVAARLHRTLNASLDAVVLVDSFGTVVEHNDALRVILRRGGCEDLVGLDALGFVAKQDRRALVRLVVNLRDSAPVGTTEVGTAQRFNMNVLRADGSLCPVELSCAIDKTGEGKFTLIGFLRDRSTEEAAAEVLRNARDHARLDAKAKERFLSVLSHEMRTPLNGVITSLELIQLGDVRPSEQGLLLTATACAKSALTQIDDVLALTRNGYLGDMDEAFVPSKVIDDIVTEIVPLGLERGNRISFDVKGDAKGASVLSKSRSFKLTVRNLISNAVKYTSNGTIDVALAANMKTPDTVVIEVSIRDTGIGISPQDHDRIFDEFTMVSDKGAEEGTGFGLGLAIAKSSVDRLQGRISLESAPGKGSRFFFTFEAPLVPMKDVVAKDTPLVLGEDKAADMPLHVLIVDDNPVNRALLSEMVRRLGHAPEMAQDGTVALSLACENRYDIILMDLSMPGMNGFDTAQRIRAESLNATTKIIALTARDLTECAAELQQTGFDGAFQKPIGMGQLRDLIDSTGHEAVSGFDGAAHPVLNSFQDVLGLMGADMTRNLVHAMLNDSRIALKALEDRSGDLADNKPIADVAHRAAGSAAVLGATRLAEVWRATEVALRSHDRSTIVALTTGVPKIYRQTVMALGVYRIAGLEQAPQHLQ